MLEMPKSLQELPPLVQYAQLRLNMDQNFFPSHLKYLSNCRATIKDNNNVTFKMKKQLFCGKIVKNVVKKPRKELHKVPILIPLRSQIVKNPDAQDLIPGFYVPVTVQEIQKPLEITIKTRSERIHRVIFHDLLLEEALDESDFMALKEFLVGKEFYAKPMSPLTDDSEPMLVDLVLDKKHLSHLLLEGMLKNVAKPLKTMISDILTPDLTDRKMVLQYLSPSDT